MSGHTAWTDFMLACLVGAYWWGPRALAWRARMAAMDAAGEVFGWSAP